MSPQNLSKGVARKIRTSYTWRGEAQPTVSAMPTRLTPTLSTALYRDNRSTRSDRNESSLETFDYQYMESHELDQNRSEGREGSKGHANCLGLLGDGLPWRKGVTSATDFPRRNYSFGK